MKKSKKNDIPPISWFELIRRKKKRKKKKKKGGRHKSRPSAPSANRNGKNGVVIASFLAEEKKGGMRERWPQGGG